MNKREIRRPTGPAIIFLINGLGFFFTILTNFLMAQIMDSDMQLPLSQVANLLLMGSINLFMSIVLFSKKYNNVLLIPTGLFPVSGIVSLFFGISPFKICNIIFFLLVLGYTYITVKMPKTPIREKAVKLRFIIPVFQFVLILISTIQMIQSLYENVTETMGAYPDGAMNIAIVMVPSILSALFGFLPVLCYIWLANWLAEPREK